MRWTGSPRVGGIDHPGCEQNIGLFTFLSHFRFPFRFYRDETGNERKRNTKREETKTQFSSETMETALFCHNGNEMCYFEASFPDFLRFCPVTLFVPGWLLKWSQDVLAVVSLQAALFNQACGALGDCSLSDAQLYRNIGGCS